MKIGFTKNQLNGIYLPNIGRFVACVTKVEIGTSQNSGGQTLKITLTGIGEHEGQTGMETFSLSEKARWRLAIFCTSCGFPKDYLTSGQFETNDLVGKIVGINRVQDGVRVYKGEEKPSYRSEFFFPEESVKQEETETFGDIGGF